VEAQRYRYRVVIEQGTRNELISRNREDEVIIEGRNNKRKRIHVIELSSDGDEPPRPPPMASGRRLSPVTVSSSTSDDESSFLDDDLENTLVQDNTLVEEREDTDDTSPESSMSSIDKGKEREVLMDLSLDLEEELECIICCLFLLVWTNYSYSSSCSPYLFTLWSWRLRSLQLFPPKIVLI